jgi:hypothetical protein
MEFFVLAHQRNQGIRLHPQDSGQVLISWGFAFGELSDGRVAWHPEWSRGLPFPGYNPDALPVVKTLRGSFADRVVLTFELGRHAPAWWGPVEATFQWSGSAWKSEANGREPRIDPGMRLGVWTTVQQEFAWEGKRIRLMSPYRGGWGDGAAFPRYTQVEDCSKAPPYFVSLDGPTPASLPSIPRHTCIEGFYPFPDGDWVMLLMLKNGALRIHRSLGGKRTSHAVKGQDFAYVERWPTISVPAADDVRLLGSFTGTDEPDTPKRTGQALALRLGPRGFEPLAERKLPPSRPASCPFANFDSCVHASPAVRFAGGTILVEQGTGWAEVSPKGQRVESLIATAKADMAGARIETTSAALVGGRVYATLRLSAEVSMTPIEDVLGVFVPKGEVPASISPPPDTQVSRELRLVTVNPSRPLKPFPPFAGLACDGGALQVPWFERPESATLAERDRALEKNLKTAKLPNHCEISELRAEGKYRYTLDLTCAEKGMAGDSSRWPRAYCAGAPTVRMWKIVQGSPVVQAGHRGRQGHAVDQ